MSTIARRSLLATVYRDGQERSRAMSIFGATLTAGMALGVILGGVLTTTLGWRGPIAPAWGAAILFALAIPIAVLIDAGVPRRAARSEVEGSGR